MAVHHFRMMLEYSVAMADSGRMHSWTSLMRPSEDSGHISKQIVNEYLLRQYFRPRQACDALVPTAGCNSLDNRDIPSPCQRVSTPRKVVLAFSSGI